MNNREAITLLRNLEDSLDSYCELNEEGKTAFRMAIEALNCSEIPNNSDTISRQAAIDALGKVAELYPWRVPGDRDSYSQYNEAWQDALNRADSEIEALPSAQPENQVNLCDSCKYLYPDCPSEADDVIFGNGKGNDNICACNKYLPSAQPETAKRIAGKSRDGMTLWYQCDMCNEPVDAQDNFCSGCGRRLVNE